MSTNKPLGRKIRLARQTKTNRRVPAWVAIKTDRKFMRHPKRHHWRIGRLKL